MEGILVSPRFDSQIRKRSSLYKKRNESPKFRDILRERCRARIKASRCSLIEKFRNLKDSEELHSAISNIVKKEAKTLLCSQGFFDEVVLTEEPEDLDDDEDRWLISEYEKILTEEEANFCVDWEKQVVCPLCEMSVLILCEKIPICHKCSIQFPPVDSLATMKQNLDQVLMNHSQNCDDFAHFAILDNQELSGLFLICETCLSFSQVL